MKKMCFIILIIALCIPTVAMAEDVRLASHNAVIEGNPYRVRYEADIQEAAAAAADHGLNVSYASFVSNWDPATRSSSRTVSTKATISCW